MSYRSTNAFLAELPDPFRTGGTIGNGLGERRSYGQCDVELYHLERNHQGLGNELIEAADTVGCTNGTVRRRKRLGGILSFYYREAA